MFHWQNIVSRNQTTSRSIHSALYIHDKFKTGWLWWEFEHLFCVPDTADIKLKNQKPWKHTKQIFPEQKTKKSFALHHLCPVHEVLTGIWNPLISAQIVNSFGQGKCTFDCQSGNLKNYASDHLQHYLYVDISYKFTLAWDIWVFVSHACTQITINTFINDLVIFTVIIQC